MEFHAVVKTLLAQMEKVFARSRRDIAVKFQVERTKLLNVETDVAFLAFFGIQKHRFLLFAAFQSFAADRGREAHGLFTVRARVIFFESSRFEKTFHRVQETLAFLL